MSKNESNSQLLRAYLQATDQRNKSLTCQRTKAIHNKRRITPTGNYSGTNLLHVKERKQFTTGGVCATRFLWAEQISYMSKNESNSQHTDDTPTGTAKRNKSLTCQRTKAIHNLPSRIVWKQISGTNLLHVKERKQFTTVA